MVVLRLRRGGRKHSPHYRLVVQEKRSKLNGAYIESIGHYHPTEANELTIDKDRAKYWLGQGAQVSDSVVNLLVKEGILPKKQQIKKTFVKPADSAEQSSATPAEEAGSADATPAEEAAPAEATPVEETKTE